MTTPEEVLRCILDHLEARIDPEHVAQVRMRHRAAVNYQALDVPPLVCYLPYEGEQIRPYPRREAMEDPAKMMVNELLIGFTSLYHAVDLRDDTPYCLRPNFGVGIVASMFGARIRLLDNHMPWVDPLGDVERLRAVAEGPLPDVRCGLGARVLEWFDYAHSVLRDYPKCRDAFEITLPDLQGPFDTAELLWGSDFYLALYTERECALALLEQIRRQMVAAYHAFRAKTRDSGAPGAHHQHGVLTKGNLLIREDTALGISPAMYREIVQPFNARLASEVGSVGIHFCGNGGHQVANMLATPGVVCLDVGQPECNDLDALYAQAAKQRVPLVRLTLPEAELTVRNVRRRFPAGVTLVYHAPSVAKAKEVWERYRCEA